MLLFFKLFRQRPFDGLSCISTSNGQPQLLVFNYFVSSRQLQRKLSIPLPTPRFAEIFKQALEVDKEVKRSVISKEFKVVDDTIVAVYVLFFSKMIGY
ncbi:hypothetical protein BKA69DRAFT_623195 [Paraphysoderma sedebokerense]|nr:hypothetical protein BKA69DRAFT_623195 [Paraphysoderma sedebokerense]